MEERAQGPSQCLSEPALPRGSGCENGRCTRTKSWLERVKEESQACQRSLRDQAGWMMNPI